MFSFCCEFVFLLLSYVPKCCNNIGEWLHSPFLLNLFLMSAKNGIALPSTRIEFKKKSSHILCFFPLYPNKGCQ